MTMLPRSASRCPYYPFLTLPVTPPPLLNTLLLHYCTRCASQFLVCKLFLFNYLSSYYSSCLWVKISLLIFVVLKSVVLIGFGSGNLFIGMHLMLCYWKIHFDIQLFALFLSFHEHNPNVYRGRPVYKREEYQ